MGLKVIGTGLGRTGTTSVKLALEQLGFGPCHHMGELFAHPQMTALWVAAVGGRGDWDAIFDGYQAAVDYPTCTFWCELMEVYPQAKLLHTVRDPDEWFDSTQATIFAPQGKPAKPEGALRPFFEAFFREMRPHLHDRTYMTDYYRRHTEAVLRLAPPDRLLVYESHQGWEPLCRFLEVPVPETPFPRENSRGQFADRPTADS